MQMSNTIFQMPNNSINNYEKTLDDLLSTKKQLSQTSALLEEKEKIKNNLLNTLEKFKNENNKLTKENEKLKKNISLLEEEKNKIENKLNKEN